MKSSRGIRKSDLQGKVPRLEETPGEPRKKSMTRTHGSFSVRSASRIFCAICVANISRFVLSVAFKMESSDWQPALPARHAKTTMATIANLDCLCIWRSYHQRIAPAKTSWFRPRIIEKAAKLFSPCPETNPLERYHTTSGRPGRAAPRGLHTFHL